MNNPLQCLRLRHSGDVFVEEAKIGSSHAGAKRLDAWVLLKTWSPWTTIGYEIKVNRQDFLRDVKWSHYLDVCHEFYFVAPKGVVDLAELPDGVGLLQTTGGARLITKRRAHRREPKPEQLLMLMSYCLMSRAQIVGDMWEAAKAITDQREVWRHWLTLKAEDRALGSMVSKAIRQVVKDAEAKAAAALRERDRLDSVRQQLVALGLEPGAGMWEVRERLAPADHRLQRVRRLVEQLQATARQIEELATPPAMPIAESGS